MIYTSLDNFYLSPAELEDSPSRRAGVAAEVEEQLRCYGCELIQEGGVLLKLPQAVMATGQVLLHRFYCKESMAVHDVKVRPGAPGAGFRGGSLAQAHRWPQGAGSRGLGAEGGLGLLLAGHEAGGDAATGAGRAQRVLPPGQAPGGAEPGASGHLL